MVKMVQKFEIQHQLRIVKNKLYDNTCILVKKIILVYWSGIDLCTPRLVIFSPMLFVAEILDSKNKINGPQGKFEYVGV